jgi:glycosyltransferase involved in cell wall biosynthesis
MSQSVVIPVRNTERTLDRQLEALERERHDEPWELVVVDGRRSTEFVQYSMFGGLG